MYFLTLSTILEFGQIKEHMYLESSGFQQGVVLFAPTLGSGDIWQSLEIFRFVLFFTMTEEEVLLVSSW